MGDAAAGWEYDVGSPHRPRTTTPALALPSAGPDPISWDTALAAVLGYARGRRPVRFRSPGDRLGRWALVPAFGYERFDRRPVPAGAAPHDDDVLVAEGLHGRLDPTGWAAVRDALARVRPLAVTATDRAAGRALWELPDEEMSVLAEPGTVGAALRDIWNDCDNAPDVQPKFVYAALHHRRPELFPLLNRTTRWQLLPHTLEGDSGAHAVIHRELRANAAAFQTLEAATAELLVADGSPLTRLRLHDILLWLTGSLRLTHAVALGRATEEWYDHDGSGQRDGEVPAAVTGFPTPPSAATLPT